jgi:hypothetical protein
MARRPCSIEVELTVGKKGYMVTVMNMGAGGMLLLNPGRGDFKAGAVARVAFPEHSPRFDVRTVECVVRWTRMRDEDGSQFVGVEYKDQKALARSWVKVTMQDLGFQSYNLKEQRAHHRTRCQFPGTLQLGDTTVRCFITDIGLGGCRVELLQPIRAGAVISVMMGEGTPYLGGLKMTGVVRHQQQVEPGDPFGYGCAFQGLTEDQEEGIKSFMQEQHELNWERTEEWAEINLFAPSEASVEIPSLSSILDESDDPIDE